MIDPDALARTLDRLDGRGYAAYRDLAGARVGFSCFELVVDHVQGDPYAAPSRMRALVPLAAAALPGRALTGRQRRRATRDFIARAFRAAVRSARELEIDAGGQTVLERSACVITDDTLELRFTVELPAADRRIRGRAAQTLLCDALPKAVERAALACHLDLAALQRHGDAVEDQVALRDALAVAGLVAFVADGAVLPRRSGIDDEPLAGGFSFTTPPSLAVTLHAPNAGAVTGMGVPRGLTLIVGGGFHGKSTLLRALEAGVWDHIPGDGRERVVSDATAATIRAEDGRAVSAVDISGFIDGLPGGARTDAFTTELASGSTSQAAALVEALEAGAGTLLLDEDTSASNFMIRDRRMQALVAEAAEPITPFVDRVRELRDVLGVSTVLVMGGSGDYFDHADTVLQMEHYRAREVTAAAHEIAHRHPTGRREQHGRPLTVVAPRTVEPRSIRPERAPGRVKVLARGRNTLVLGRSEIDLRAVHQLVDPSQLRAIGWLLVQLSRWADDVLPAATAVDRLLARLANDGWGWLTGRPDGDLALPRRHEVMAAVNRLRGVTMRTP